MIVEVLSVISFSYILGSIPSGIIFAKIFNLKDLRTIGSGNTAKIRVDAELTDKDGSEQLSIILKLPSDVSGATFVPSSGSAVTGTVVTNLSGYDGQRVVSFDVASGQEKTGKFEFELSMASHFSGTASIDVIARSTDGSDTEDTSAGTHSVTVTPVADAPTSPSVTVEAGSEDQLDPSGATDPARLNVSMTFPDASEGHFVIVVVDSNAKHEFSENFIKAKALIDLFK